MSTPAEHESFLEKIWDAIASLFSKSNNALKEIATIADNFVNALKAAEASPTGQAIESIIELIIPSSTGLINALKLAFPIAQQQLANIEDGKTQAELEQAFLSWLTGLKTSDPNLYAGALTTINAWVQKFLADNQGEILPIENALANTQIVHTLSLQGGKTDCPQGQYWNGTRCVKDVG